MKLFIAVILLISPVISIEEAPKKLNPVVLVPGDGGSQFQAKLNKPSSVARYCVKQTDYYFDLWLNLELLVPYVIDCFVDNMRLVYDNKTRTTSNSPGVDIRIPGFGETETVEYLDHSELSLTTYFHNIVEGLVKLGYEKNVTIKGAPYDFRKAPNELGEYINNLQALIEETYYSNGNTKVVLLGHSMGNPMALFLLNKMSKSWKAKFIQCLISLAGVWGGAMKPIRLMISGDNLDVPIVKSINVRREQRSMPSTAWLMPSDEFWSPDEVLVVAPERNYTIKDIKQLFQDIEYPPGYMMWEDTKDLIKPLRAPGVELHCLHGTNVSTPGQFIYTKKTWKVSSPETIPDNGDGTVNTRSLVGCLRFKDKQSQPVYHKVFDKAEHMQILNRKDVMEEIGRILLGKKEGENFNN